jgi:hypothetical protein
MLRRNPLNIWYVDGTGSGSCPVADFGISGVVPWGFVSRDLVS